MPHTARLAEPSLSEDQLAEAVHVASQILDAGDVQAAVALVEAEWDPAMAQHHTLHTLSVAVAAASALATLGLPLSALASVVTEVAPLVGGRAMRGAQLPSAELALWESVGASFSDGAAVEQARKARVAAFSSLLARSVHGDAEMAAMLGVDRSRVSQRVSERSIFAFDGPDGRCFPSWQIHDGKPIRGLKAVLEAFDAGLHALTIDHWMTALNGDLRIDDEPVSPVEWLRTGGAPSPVVRLARDL